MPTAQLHEQILLDEQPPAGLSAAERAYWERIRERLVRGMLAYREANYVSDEEWELRLASARGALSGPMPPGSPANPEKAEREALQHRIEDVPDLPEEEYTRYVIAGMRRGAISGATERLHSQESVEAWLATWGTE